AGLQAEAGVVPRAADRVTDHEALGERAAVVRARRADGEDAIAAPRQEHRLATGVAEERTSILHLAGLGAVRDEIRTRELSCLSTHACAPYPNTAPRRPSRGWRV